MGKVIDFNGITKLDFDPDKVLEGAMGKLDSVIILGYTKDEDEYFACSLADGGEANWLLDRCKIKLLTIDLED